MRKVVDDCLALDANKLAKMGIFREGSRSGVKWKNGSSIGLDYADGTLTLHYALNGEHNDQTVRVTAAPCHFGGKRYYMHCPCCTKRRYKLHLANDGFYCRECYRLPYYSQQCGFLDGLIHKMHKVEAKLLDIDRPRMRTYTQMRLINRHNELEDEIDNAIIQRYGRAAVQERDVARRKP